MSLKETKNGVQYFLFEHSKDYQKVQFQFYEAVESLNPQNIAVCTLYIYTDTYNFSVGANYTCIFIMILRTFKYLQISNVTNIVLI